MLPFFYFQLFLQPTHFPALPLCNTLPLCNAFLSSLLKFFQIYYTISLLNNSVMNIGRKILPNLPMDRFWKIIFMSDIHCLEPRHNIWNVDHRAAWICYLHISTEVWFHYNGITNANQYASWCFYFCRTLYEKIKLGILKKTFLSTDFLATKFENSIFNAT